MTVRSVKRLEQGYRAMAADEEREAEAEEWAEALIADAAEAVGKEKFERKSRPPSARHRRKAP